MHDEGWFCQYKIKWTWWKDIDMNSSFICTLDQPMKCLKTSMCWKTLWHRNWNRFYCLNRTILNKSYCFIGVFYVIHYGSGRRKHDFRPFYIIPWLLQHPFWPRHIKLSGISRYFFLNYSMLVLPEGLLGLNPISETDNNIPMLNRHAQQQTLCFL